MHLNCPNSGLSKLNGLLEMFRRRHVFNPLQSPSCRFSSKRRADYMRHYHDDGRIEEQTLPQSAQRTYYPVRIGQKFNDRYHILAKVGFGAYSSVWLARDGQTDKYASIKVCVKDDSITSPILDEIQTLRHLACSPKEHPGSKYIRLHDEVFQTDDHYCIVSKPQGCSLWTLQSMFPNGKVPKEIVAHAVQRLLGCVNWLVCDCEVIHTEITAQNVLMETTDDAVFRRAERAENNDPTIPIENNGYPVYRSRGQPLSLFELALDPVLTDFGSSRSAATTNDDWWMIDTHRAPEVAMGLPWNDKVDVWSIGIMALELLEGRNLFTPIDTIRNQYVLPLAVSQYIGFMGSPPKWMNRKSMNPVIKTFFDEEGHWIAEPPAPRTSLEEFVTAIPPGEEKDKFMRFIRKILVWDPAERAHSAELFSDEWLMPS